MIIRDEDTAKKPTEDLRKKLYDELLAKARARREASQQKLGETQAPTAEDYEQAVDDQRLRAFQSGMQSAANRIGNFQGVAASNKPLEQTLQAFDDADAASLKTRQALFDKADSAAQEAETKFIDTNKFVVDSEHQDKTRPLDLEIKQLSLNADRLDFGNKSRLSDPNSPESTYARKFAKDMFKLDVPPTATASQLSPMLGLAEKKHSMETQAQLRRDAQVASAQSRKDAATAREEARQDARANKVADAQQKKQDVAAKSQEEANYRVTTMKANLDDLEKLVNEYGTVELFGDASSRMDNLLYQTAVDYAKLVDPNSVAREGEVAAAQKYMLPIRGFGIKNETAISLIRKMKGDIARRSTMYKDAHGGSKTGTTPEEKTVNGVRYRKVDGGWEAVE